MEFVHKHRVAINLVLSYLYEIYEFTYKKVDSRKSNTTKHVDYVMDKFFTLCHDYHVEQHKIQFYAERLNITPRYLNTIARKTLDTTPKDVIDYYISGSAKRILLTTSLTNQQIADKLNFPDQATFGQFFKRNVGLTPNEFRNKFK